MIEGNLDQLLEAYDGMPQSFFAWLLECPVNWTCIKIDENINYFSFDKPEEEEQAQAYFVLVRELAALEASRQNKKVRMLGCTKSASNK